MNEHEFYRYCLAVYGPNGEWPMGATMEQVKAATEVLLTMTKYQGVAEFAADSFDRERVGDILKIMFRLQDPEPEPVPPDPAIAHY